MSTEELSTYELTLLFYNCLSAYGEKKFRPLAEEYALFENMSPKVLLKPKHAQEFGRGAFGDAYEEFAAAL